MHLWKNYHTEVLQSSRQLTKLCITFAVSSLIPSTVSYYVLILGEGVIMKWVIKVKICSLLFLSLCRFHHWMKVSGHINARLCIPKKMFPGAHWPDGSEVPEAI